MTAPFMFVEEVQEQARSLASGRARIATRNRLMRERFDADVRATDWHRMEKAEVFRPPPKGIAVVIGVVLWNRTDLEALSRLAAEPGSSCPEIYIFDLDEVQSAGQLEQYMPGVPLPTKTPVVAQYDGGQLRQWADGTAGIEGIQAPL